LAYGDTLRDLSDDQRIAVMKLAGVLIVVVIVAIALASIVPPAQAARPGFVFPGGCCYYEGTLVRTVVPPSAFPNEGRDNFYGISGGVAAQKGVVAVAPGDVGYHGGHWKFFAVTWNVAPYLLTSEAAILYAHMAGDVTVTRVPANDFLCPIQK